MKHMVFVNFKTKEVYGINEMYDKIEGGVDTSSAFAEWLRANYDMVGLFNLLPEDVKEKIRDTYTDEYVKDFEDFEIE